MIEWKILKADRAELERYVLPGWRKSARSLRLQHDHDRARGILRGLSTLLVAEHPEFPDVVAGWCLVTQIEPPVLHYLYVRSYARGRGCAAALLRAAGVGRDEVLTTQDGKLPPRVRGWFEAVTVIDAALMSKERQDGR